MAIRLPGRISPALSAIAFGGQVLLAHDPAVAQEADARLRNAGRSDRVEVRSIGRSADGREILMASVTGPGDGVEGPAILVIAGTRASHRIGTEVAIALVERLSRSQTSDTLVRGLLDRVTFHVIPTLSPDASRAAEDRPAHDGDRNAQPYDDDRDGYVDEDGPDDLNGDGRITLMRIADPAGAWIEDEQDPGLMRSAVPAKGERSAWLVMTEGVDDDRDGRFNEDPAGGADIGVNFPRRYPWFTPGAGTHPLSAPESRALAELLAGHDEIGTVVVLGTRDNLVSAWKAKPDGGGSGDEAARILAPLESVMEPDAPWFAEISRRYRETTGRAEADTLGIRSPGGDPLSWAYYQMGRWAFGSSVWTIPGVVADTPESAADSAAARPDSTDSPSGSKPAGGSDVDPVAAERRRLRWTRANRPDDFIDWEPVDHPDFPDRRVEVGGFVPFTEWEPPVAVRDSIVAGEVEFLLELGTPLPTLEIVEARSESLGGGTWRVTAKIANTGFLPTRPEVAERLGRPRSIRVDLETNGQEIAGGRKVQILDALPGGGPAAELSWIVIGRGNGRVTVRAGAPSAGEVREEVTLQ
jgi:hypothetical protein